MFRRHFFLIAAVCVLALMLVAGGLKLAASAAGGRDSGQGPGRGPGGRGNGPVAVSGAVVQLRPFVDRIDVLGVAKGRQSVTVTSNTTELITAVHFKDGAFVRKGQPLVDLKAQAETAGIAEAQAGLNLAQLEYQRWKTLGAQGIAAQSAVDQRKAALQQAQATLEAARSRRGDRKILAPFSGVVGLSDVAPGALINPGGPIASLDDIAVIKVDFDVPDRYLAALKPGVLISARTDAYPDKVERGHIATLDTRIDEKTRAIKARAEFPNADGRLRPGMLMHVSVDRGGRQSPAAPEAAVEFEGEQAYVFVLQKGPRGMTAQRRPVQTGVDDGGFIEIKSGVQPGELVVADGVNKVNPGQAVRLASAGGGSGPGEHRSR